MNLRLTWQLRRWHRQAAQHARLDASARVNRSPFIDKVSVWGSALCEQVAITFHRREARVALRFRQAEAQLHNEREAAARTRAHADLQLSCFAEARTAADQKHRELNPPDGPWSIAPWAYRSAFAGLCLGDLPLTFLAFQTFDLDPVMTLFVAAVTVLLLGALGHFAGSYARRLGWREVYLLGAVLALSGGFVFSLTYLRETALQAVARDEAIGGLGPVLIFALLTAMGFIVPALLAYHVRHEPLAYLVRQAKGRWRSAERRARRAERRLQRSLQRMEHARADRKLLIASALASVNQIRHLVEDVIHSYRLEYVRQREGDEPPGLVPNETVTVPPSLLTAAAQEQTLAREV